MKTILPFIISSLISSAPAMAEVTVSASLIGQARVDTSIRTKYRHSADCYPFGKGSDYEDGPRHTVTFDSSQSMKNSNVMSWSTSISNPFSRMARSVHIRSLVKETFDATTVDLTMYESRGASSQQYRKSDCWHKDGQMTVNDATLSGFVKVQYKVPNNVWAISIERSPGVGVLDQYMPVVGAMNAAYDQGQQDGVILWVTPGQVLEQEFTIPEGVPGRLDLGQAQIVFHPISRNLTLDDFNEFRKKLKNGFYSKNLDAEGATKLIVNSLGLVRMDEQVQSFVRETSILDLKRMSDDLFDIANSVIPHSFQKGKSYLKPDGFAIKTAAALASYQLTKALMQDLKSYCQQVEVTLPFTGEKQHVLGLRAASFWLTRSLGLVKSYSYDGFESMIRELQELQSKGVTPADIVKNKELAKKLQTSYQLLTKSGVFDQSPFNIAYVDMNRMLTVFKDLGTIGASQAGLMAQLEEGSNLEGAFSKGFVRTLLMFKASRTELIDMSPLLSSIQDLKHRQKEVAMTMTRTIRLLGMEGSDNQTTVLNQISILLNNQINIVSQPLSVPYFEKIREEYMKTQVGDLEQSVQGCIGGY